MIWGLLWIIGIYGATVAILHCIHAWYNGRTAKPTTTYFALMTHNNETQIEWYLRTLVFFSWMRGRQISIVVFDEGSTDETLTIIRRFAAERGNVEIRVSSDSLEEFLEAHQDEAVVVHRVNGLGKDEALPVLQW